MVSKYVEKSLKERYKDTKAEIDKAIETTQVDSSLITHYNKNGGTAGIAGDYMVNGMVSSIEYTKIFSGDPAFFKDLPDLIKRIPATYTDGLQLALSDADDMKFRMAVVNGVEVARSMEYCS